MTAKKKLEIKKNWWVGALIGSVLLNLLLLIKDYYGKNFSEYGVKVIGVIDGDTLVLDGKSKIRLRYVDAPELQNCGGKEAKAVLERMVVGKKVEIREQIPDQYGRGMAIVIMGEKIVNGELLKSGWVRYHHDNTEYTVEMQRDFAESKTRNSGLYGVCQSRDVPDKPRCVIKGNIDNNGKSRNYYLPGCSQYKFTVIEKDMGEGWFCTEKEAQKAGFTRAKTC